MSTSAALALLLLFAALSLMQGWRHAGRQPRRRRVGSHRPSGRAGRRPTPVGHDRWARPGPYRKPRPRPGCDTYVYWPWNADGDGPDRSGRAGYVGKALDWRERVPDHDDKDWWCEVYPVPDVQRVGGEREALAREWYLIGELDAIFNVRRPNGWVRTGRATPEVMRGFRLAQSGLAYRGLTVIRTRQPVRTSRRSPRSIRGSGRATSIFSTGRSWRSW